jgi:hypothetical protein
MLLPQDTKQKLDELRQRVRLREQVANDAAKAAAGQEVHQSSLDMLGMMETLPAIPDSVRDALQQYNRIVDAGEQNDTDDILAIMNKTSRVRNFCDIVGIRLAKAVASHEARYYVEITVNSRYVDLWLDLSALPTGGAQRAACYSYAQAMRTAIGRLRRTVRNSGTARTLRTFGIRVCAVEPVQNCRGLWRMRLDSQPDIAKDMVTVLVHNEVLNGLTLETNASRAAPTVLEQKAAMTAFGIKDE